MNARNLGHENAWCAKRCPKSGASHCTGGNDSVKTGTDYCMVCNGLSEIQGI